MHRYRLLFPILFFLSGCTTFHSYTYKLGPTLDDTELASISKQTTRQELYKKYGQPSFPCSKQKKNNVCYFYQIRKHDSIMAERYVEFIFDKKDFVKDVIIHDLKDFKIPEED